MCTNDDNTVTHPVVKQECSGHMQGVRIGLAPTIYVLVHDSYMGNADSAAAGLGAQPHGHVDGKLRHH